MRSLRASVAAGEPAPVIMLSGEADIASAAQLTTLIDAQLNAGAVHLTINASGLSCADSMAVQVLVVAAKILRARGGGLVLFRPQRPVARTLTPVRGLVSWSGRTGGPWPRAASCSDRWPRCWPCCARTR